MKRFFLPFLAIAITLSGCASLLNLAALKKLDFDLRDATNLSLAGVNFDDVNSYSDLSAFDVAKLARAYITKDLPLAFTLNVNATNPPENKVDAKIMQMEWALFVKNTRTITGNFDRQTTVPVSGSAMLPIGIRFNVLDFFSRNDARGVFDLAKSAVGRGGSPADLRLSAKPTIQTPLGPIQYPGYIDIIKKSF